MGSWVLNKYKLFCPDNAHLYITMNDEKTGTPHLRTNEESSAVDATRQTRTRKLKRLFNDRDY
jgi:hypothetical protein